MEKKEVGKMLEAAFAALSAVFVRGEDVERMAEARACLRQAWAALAAETERGD